MSRSHSRARALGLVAAAASLLALTAATPVTAEAPFRLAQAYPVYPVHPVYPAPSRRYAPLPLHEVEAIVRSLGLRPVSPPRPQGPFFIVHAEGREGSLVRVVIDRRSGGVSEIVRLGRGAPEMARMRPGWSPRPYDDDDDDLDYYYDDGDDDAVLLPPGRSLRSGAPRTAPGSGPSIITRDGDIVTGSVPRSAATPPPGADPLLGVPPEFRGRPARSAPAAPPRTAARPSPPRIAPLPPKRPDDAPSLAQREDASAQTPRAIGKGAEDWPPPQAFD